MKITKKQLEKLIKETVKAQLKEASRSSFRSTQQSIDHAAAIAAGDAYTLPVFGSYPVLGRSNKVVWSENNFEKGIVVVKLQDFDLTKEDMAVVPALAMRTAVALATVVQWSGIENIQSLAIKEFRKTKKIKGALFLTPDLQKIWLSHYDVKHLTKISDSKELDGKFEESKQARLKETSSQSMEYAPAQDRKGQTLRPGDRVRFKMYPKGVGEGVVVVSKRSQEVLPDGSTAPALAIDSDGRTFSLSSKGTLKLKESKQARLKEQRMRPDQIAKVAKHLKTTGMINQIKDIAAFLKDKANIHVDKETAEKIRDLATSRS